MWDKIKKYLLLLVLPFGVLLSMIYYYFTRNKNLIEKLEREKAQNELKENLKNVEESKKKADSAVADFNEFKHKHEDDNGGPDDAA